MTRLAHTLLDVPGTAVRLPVATVDTGRPGPRAVVTAGIHGAGVLDFVACWYVKAARYLTAETNPFGQIVEQAAPGRKKFKDVRFGKGEADGVLFKYEAEATGIKTVGALPATLPPLCGVMVPIRGLGALAGAMLGESWKGRDLDHGWLVGQAAFWGRLLGTAGKLAVGAAIVAVVLAGLLLR